METHARYFLIGIFSLLVTAGLITFVLWLGKLQLGKEYQEYDVRFHESVAGLAVGGAVQFHGIQIGEVRKLSLDPVDPREISVIVRVTANAPVKTDTKAQLSYTGLTGVAVIELFDGTPEAQLLREADTSAAPRIKAVSSSLSKLLDGSSGAVSGAQEVMARAAKLLSDANIARVSQLLDDLQILGTNVNKDYPQLRAALADARALEQRLSRAAERADSLLAQVQQGIASNAAPSGSDQAIGDQANRNLFAEARGAIAAMRDAAASVQSFANVGAGAVTEIDSRQLNAEMLKLIKELRLASTQLERVTRRFDQAPVEYLMGSEALPVYSPKAQDKR
jgi:phospholipid/cholesterol/gamma-HCH transport system substrate-binding protein